MTTSADAQPTIADRVTQMHDGLAGQIPEEILAVFGAEQAGLDEGGVPVSVAQPGARVPDVPLLDAHGEPTTLLSATKGRPAVIVLYRGTWCPYCNLALRAYQEGLLPELQRRGIALAAISPQKPDGSLSMQEKNALTFTVLSDPGNQIATALGVSTAPTEDARSAQRKLGTDLTTINADGTAGVPMPTVAIIDGAGRLDWIDVHPNYTTRTEVSEIVAALDRAI